VKSHHSPDNSCVVIILPDSLLRLGVVTALSRLGMVLHQSDKFDPIECSPELLVVEPSHLPECLALYPGIPTLTVSLFESAVAATPATSPNEVLSRVRALLPPTASFRQLSPREHQILTLVASGMSNEQIAGECYIAVESVRTHLTRIYRKLGARNRVSAVTVATRQGILTL
jgi:DNA-binding CsgD family transcriptional regulator